jgi:hypothetical protein
VVTARALPPGIKVTKNDHRPWSEKWRAVLDAHEQLMAPYEEPERLGNLEVERRVTRFFGECHDLRDWLLKHLPPNVTEDEVWTQSRQPSKSSKTSPDPHTELVTGTRRVPYSSLARCALLGRNQWRGVVAGRVGFGPAEPALCEWVSWRKTSRAGRAWG